MNQDCIDQLKSGIALFSEISASRPEHRGWTAKEENRLRMNAIVIHGDQKNARKYSLEIALREMSQCDIRQFRRKCSRGKDLMTENGKF
jgi:hypothetical protein